MERAQQIAALRRELRDAFPSSHALDLPGHAHHVDHAGLPSGIPTLDRALVGSGLPRGRITELTGAPSSGRTTIALRLAASAARSGLPVLWIDACAAFFPPSAAAAGVPLERLLLVRAASITAAMKAADIALRSQSFSLVVFDWTADPGSGPAFPDIGSAIARLNGLCALSRTALVFLTSPKTARDPLRYYATLRIETRREPASSSDARAALPKRDAGHLRLLGLPSSIATGGIGLHIVKYKLGPQGARVEVSVDGGDAARLPLHAGLPDSGPSTR